MDLSKSLVLESGTIYVVSYPIEIIDEQGKVDYKDVLVYSTPGKGVSAETLDRNESNRIPLSVFL